MKALVILALSGMMLLASCSQDAKTDKFNGKYEVIAIDSTEREIIIKSVITERLVQEDLIHITYLEKIKRDWQHKFVVYFYLHSTNNTAYATATYLNDCSNCNSVDPAYNRIDFNLNLGEESQQIEKSSKIPKEINSELLVVSFYEEVWKATSYIVFDDDEKQNAMKIMYFENGDIMKVKLLKESENIFREINDDFPEEKPRYKIIDGFVEYIHSDGSVGYTYPVSN